MPRTRRSTSGAGASAQLEADRERRAERTRQHRRARWTLPLGAVAATLCGVPLALVLGVVGGAAVALVIVAATWHATYRSSGSSWAAGAAGERRTARMLAPLAWAGFIQVLHDRAIERSNANLDHLIFGKFGVLYADTKNWSSTKSKLRLDRHGVLRYGKYPKTGEIATVRWEADRASQTLGWPVRAVIAVHGARVPGGCIHLDGVTVIQASLLRRYILRLPKAPGWNRQMVRETVDVADTRLPEAAKKHPATYPAKGRRPSRPTTRHKSRTRT